MTFQHKFALGAVLFATMAMSGRVSGVTIFGLPNTALGQATLAPNATGGLDVSNVGASGQDGDSIDLTSVPQSGGSGFSLDTTLTNLGTVPTGGTITQTAYGSTGVGATGVVSTVAATQLSSSVSVSESFASVSNGQPLTVNYYSGGPNGSLVFSEDYFGTNPVINLSKFPNSFFDDYTFVGNGPLLHSYSAGFDSSIKMTIIQDANGVPLPPDDNITFIDILAPTNLQPQDSSLALTGGGGISSFTIASEAVAVPEPASVAILGSTALGLLMRRRGGSDDAARREKVFGSLL